MTQWPLAHVSPYEGYCELELLVNVLIGIQVCHDLESEPQPLFDHRAPSTKWLPEIE